MENFQSLAEELGKLGPIGSSNNLDYAPIKPVIDATTKLLALESDGKELFEATMILIRQIRNNLFHGKKMEIADREAMREIKN